MRKLLTVLLICAMSMSLVSFTLASDMFISNDEIYIEVDSRMQQTLREQTNLLLELQDILRTESSIAALSDTDATQYLPTINKIISPLYSGFDTFMVGLDIDHSHLCYSDIDAIIELSMKKPPQEVIDMILGFSGIRSENIVIGYGIFQRTPPLPYGSPLPEYCPVWGDSLVEIQNDALHMPFAVLHMGNRVRVDGFGHSTVGHPLNSNGTRFFSSFHVTSIINGRNVFLYSIPVRVGTVANSIFNNSVDVTEINLAVSSSIISSYLPFPWPSGSRIMNFRGNARVGDTVRSIRGISGVQEGQVSYVGFNHDGGLFSNKILMHTHGPSISGDSGSALIRVSDNAILGTRHGRFTHFGVAFGVYTNVQRY